jgi:hypothetical protein
MRWILGVLLRLGYNDERMIDTFNLVELKQDSNGRWIRESRLSSRFQVTIERRYATSKWVTLKALEALKGYYGSTLQSD